MVEMIRLNIGMPYAEAEVLDKSIINVSTFPLIEPIDGFLYCHHENLSPIVDDGELEYLSCKNILNYISHKEIKNCLINWCKKLRHNGELFLIFEDTSEICRLLTIGALDEETSINLLYGEQMDGWAFKKSGISVSFIKNLLVEIGMIIEDIKLESFYCYLTARRK